jgi:hypothetical protein
MADVAETPTGRWLIRAGLSTILVWAATAEDAQRVALTETGFWAKPWVARDWIIRPATDDEVREFEARKGRDRYRKSRVSTEPML